MSQISQLPSRTQTAQLSFPLHCKVRPPRSCERGSSRAIRGNTMQPILTLYRETFPEQHHDCLCAFASHTVTISEPSRWVWL